MQVQATMDIQNMYHFLQRNFYHHESLLSFADFLRLQGKFADAFEFLERCLFAFEHAFCYDFMPVQPGNAPDKAEEESGEYFVPQVLLQQNYDSEPLNTIFGDCLVKYIDVLGRKGCCRTALEYCKLLFGLNQQNDTHGVLLRIDYYAHRAREYQYLLDFMSNFSAQVYATELTKAKKISSIKLMPNHMLGAALALKNLSKAEESKSRNADIEKCHEKINKCVEENTLHELFEIPEDPEQSVLEPDLFIILTMLLYPQLLKQLLTKIAKKQFTQNLKKSWYQGYQSQNWKNIL